MEKFLCYDKFKTEQQKAIKISLKQGKRFVSIGHKHFAGNSNFKRDFLTSRGIIRLSGNLVNFTVVRESPIII